MNFTEIQKEILLKTDSSISKYGTKNSDAFRKTTIDDGVRLPFSIDRDRIIYSGAYRRYTGKTQVIYFSAMKDEQISSRIIHTQYVSQISRTIGRALSLNLDLIEAAALGHDLGHTPFGHDGERLLSKLCESYGIGKFNHNIHSLYIVDKFSYGGKGMNLTFQTRDAIISHNGEIHESKILPNREKNEDDISDYIKYKKNGNLIDKSRDDENRIKKFLPATLEAAVIRMSDTVSYIGTDIEDAIRLKLIKRSDIPANITKLLGNNNGQIIDTLVKDIVENSYEQGYIKMSDEISNALRELKSFNYKNIYLNDVIKNEMNKISYGFKILFETYLEDIEKDRRDNSNIFDHFLVSKNEDYITNTNIYEKVRDFIASMTDRYFKQELERIVIP